MKRDSLKQMIKLSDKQKKQISDEIEAFYADVRGEDIGIIEREQIIDLFLEHLAPIVYNKALDDAEYWYRQQMENLAADYYLLYRDR